MPEEAIILPPFGVPAGSQGCQPVAARADRVFCQGRGESGPVGRKTKPLKVTRVCETPRPCVPAPERLPDRYGPGAGGVPRCVCPSGAVADKAPPAGGRLAT